MIRTTFIAFGVCIKKLVPVTGSDSWDVFVWNYGGWRWNDNVGDGTVEYIRTNATEIAAPMTETQKQALQELADQAQELKMGYETADEATESRGDE